jgi:hypothetical protein
MPASTLADARVDEAGPRVHDLRAGHLGAGRPRSQRSMGLAEIDMSPI